MSAVIRMATAAVVEVAGKKTPNNKRNGGSNLTRH
jgi:hypothetical protein